MTEAQRLSVRSCVTVNGNGSTLSCRKRSIAITRPSFAPVCSDTAPNGAAPPFARGSRVPPNIACN